MDRQRLDLILRLIAGGHTAEDAEKIMVACQAASEEGVAAFARG
ncbi:hypothetical protein [Planobispora takensis]|uniref:Uncharacterized protein n=1 Tax=Planobispora takensis TaxID=1367882 RepID=A0A8J3SPT1_9ACTN|nr:hypothetical protein [Planobispora takensis]GIH98077.1 hypothetical protein Pta02_00860 [Planobispora takensis]